MANNETARTDVGVVSICPYGTFVLGTAYPKLAVVESNGSSYIAKTDNQNKPLSDTTVWYLLASKGDKGDTYEVTPEDLQAIANQITSDASSAFNQHVATKTTEFDNHVTSKTGDFDTNASNKTTTFNNNATSKTGDFNDNATSKTTDFNTNASDKTTAFNTNAQAKVDYYNQNADELIAFNEELLDQIPTATVEGTAINVTDSSNLPLADIQIKGNASQTTNILTYKCSGSESGDYYFTYNEVNYQFTMPTVTTDEILTFDTSTLKLYQGTTEITTTTASTGTLITLSSTPSPDYPQPISVVTGDNTVKLIDKNIFNGNDTYVSSGSMRSVSFSDNTLSISGNLYVNRVVVFFIPVIVGKQITVSHGTITITQGSTAYMTTKEYDEIPESIVLNDQVRFDNTKTFTTTKKYVAVGFRVGNDGIASVSNIQVEYGSTATAFEPYTEQSQLISLGVVNLFNAEEVTTNDGHYRNDEGTVATYASLGYTTSYMEVKPNTTYTLSGNISDSGGWGRIYYLDSNKDWISRTSGYNGDITFTTPNNCYYIQFSYKLDFVDFSTIQLEEGSIASSYSPYGATPTELAKIGDYEDYIYKENGKWYKYGAIEKAVFDGSENWTISSSSGTPSWYYKGPSLPFEVNNGVPNTNRNKQNYYVTPSESISADTTSQGLVAYHITATQTQIRIRYGEEDTIDNFKTWLSTHNLVVYILRRTPTITEITDTTLKGQLDSLFAMKTNRNITNMFTDTDNETPTLAVLYRQDLTTLFNNLTSAILSLGNNT